MCKLNTALTLLPVFFLMWLSIRAVVEKHHSFRPWESNFDTQMHQVMGLNVERFERHIKVRFCVVWNGIASWRAPVFAPKLRVSDKTWHMWRLPRVAKTCEGTVLPTKIQKVSKFRVHGICSRRIGCFVLLPVLLVENLRCRRELRPRLLAWRNPSGRCWCNDGVSFVRSFAFEHRNTETGPKPDHFLENAGVGSFSSS